jgi:hypothetical protein
MAGGGVGSGQDKPVSLSSTQPVDIHLLASILQRSGIPYRTAQAFAQGGLVENAAERRAIASMFSDAIRQLSGSRQPSGGRR